MKCTLAVICLRTFGVACLSAALLFTVAAAHAAQPYQEYRKHIESAQTITALSDELMGDSVSLYNGATEFTVTDISLPGNNALPVQLRRRFSMEIVPGGSPGSTAGDPNYRGAGNWDIEVPYLSATWGQGAWPNTRCSAATFPSVPAPLTPTDGWQGNSVHLPTGDRKLLGLNASNVPQPTDGAAWKWTTRERDMVRCIPMQSGLAGEGFLLQTSDGLKFYFDMATTRYAGYINYQPGDGFPPASFNRTRYYLLASRVEDRFGNWTTYSYNAAGHPTAIASSDGRSIALAYTNGRLTTATANGRTWSYAYGSSGDDNGMLTSVSQPDASQWQYAHLGTLFPDDGGIWDGNSNSSCGIKPPAVAAAFTFTATHPSGAVGAFQFSNKRHPRSGVHLNVCNQIVSGGQISYKLQVPNYFDVMSLTSKTLSGPGLSAQTWTYSYPSGSVPLWGTRGANQPYPCTTCASEKTVTVTEPDSTSKQYRYGYLYASNEGRLLGTTTLDAGGVARRVESTEYVSETEAPGQNFYGTYGIYGFGYGADDPSSVAVRPVKQQTVVQDGVTFTMQVNTGCGSASVYCFDVYGRPTNVTKSSTLNYSKAETTTYYDNTALWMLGQVSAQWVGGILATETGFDSLARPVWSKAFGKLQQTLTYNADGTVATVKDGNNNVTTLTNWYRGIPRNIQYADSTTKSAVVNDNGWITATTDENGFATGYGYDTMGRLASIVYPTDDSSAWNTETIGFYQTQTNEHGLAPGHWTMARRVGNRHVNTYYDAMWRPVLEEQFDYANIAGTLSQTVKRYDASGRLAFQSYPTTNVGDFNSITQGSRTTYDALDRVTRVEQDSELGVLASTTEYLAGFQTRVTNPRNQQTTNGYQAYDAPSYDLLRWSVQPEGKVIEIFRHPQLGNPEQVRQRNSDGTLQQSRYYVYDSYRQLCKTIEPETGATVMGYDGAGNLSHSWSGLSLPDTNSCNSDEAWQSGRLVWRRYTARNQVDALRFSDGRGDQNITYTPDGLPSQITTWNEANSGGPVVNAYSYNKRRMLTGESVAQTGWYAWGIGYGYDANGALLNNTYPTGLVVNYSPNALGQATAVTSTDGWTYASGVSYYPNGAIKQFTFGNGLTHNMAQNARQLPARVTDGGNALDHDYGYDANGNVDHIYDYIVGAPTAQHRYMTYDGLDRLTGTGSAMFGGSDHWHRFTYDALDNLKSWKHAGIKDYAEYVYDTKNQLTNIKNTAGASVVGLSYDVQGNLANKNGQTYAFDQGNRLRETTGKEWYRYDGHGRRVLNWRWSEAGVLSQYSQSGQLLYDENYRASGRKATEYVYLAGSLITTRARNIDANTWAVSFQHTDALGSPVAVTNTAGAVIERTNWEPYGAAINKPAYDGIGYTGHVMDGATGLTYMQQRYYDPGIGRFLSVDPVTANSSTGANFNRYWYANNNPYKFKDPDGRYICKGSKADCGVVADAMKSIAKAAANLPSGSKEQKALNDVTSFYGEPGKRNGVTVKIGSREGSIGGASTKNGKATIGIAVSSIAQNTPGRGSAKFRDRLAGTVAHEGDHGVDQKANGMPTDRASEKAHEIRANTAEAALFQGLNSPNSGKELWMPEVGRRDDMIEKSAENSTNLWCSWKEGGC